MSRTAIGFITFEGIEGSGKTTQIRLLAAHLESRGVQHLVTREPGGTEIGEKIRALLLDPANNGMVPLAELFLYGAARSQHIEEVIEPAVARGEVVLCDRFTDATVAYQGYGRELPANIIKVMNSLVCADTKPDLTILLDMEPEAGLARARARNQASGDISATRFDDEELAFHRRVREGYLELARMEAGRIRVVQAEPRPEKISRQIIALVSRRLGLD